MAKNGPFWCNFRMQPSTKSVAQKLGVKEGKKTLVLYPPKGYREVVGAASVDEADIIQIFVSSTQEVLEFVEKNRAQFKKSVAIWVTYPKASPKLGINRDILVQLLLPYNMEGVAICSIDEIWSGLRFKIV